MIALSILLTFVLFLLIFKFEIGCIGWIIEIVLLLFIVTLFINFWWVILIGVLIGLIVSFFVKK